MMRKVIETIIDVHNKIWFDQAGVARKFKISREGSLIIPTEHKNTSMWPQITVLLSTERIRIKKNVFQAKDRSSHSQLFFKIGVMKNFATFTGKHLCWNLFLIKLQA